MNYYDFEYENYMRRQRALQNTPFLDYRNNAIISPLPEKIRKKEYKQNKKLLLCH